MSTSDKKDKIMKVTVKDVAKAYKLMCLTDGENTDAPSIPQTYMPVGLWATNPNKTVEDVETVLSKVKNQMTLSGSRGNYGRGRGVPYTETSDWDFFTTEESVFEDMCKYVRGNAIAKYEQYVGSYQYMGAIGIHKYRLIDGGGRVYDIQITLCKELMSPDEAYKASLAKKVIKGNTLKVIMVHGDDDLKRRYLNVIKLVKECYNRPVKLHTNGKMSVGDHQIGVCDISHITRLTPIDDIWELVIADARLE